MLFLRLVQKKCKIKCPRNRNLRWIQINSAFMYIFFCWYLFQICTKSECLSVLATQRWWWPVVGRTAWIQCMVVVDQICQNFSGDAGIYIVEERTIIGGESPLSVVYFSCDCYTRIALIFSRVFGKYGLCSPKIRICFPKIILSSRRQMVSSSKQNVSIDIIFIFGWKHKTIRSATDIYDIYDDIRSECPQRDGDPYNYTIMKVI